MTDVKIIDAGNALRQFESMSAAFDYCRDMNHPVTVVVRQKGLKEKWKLYPSGSGKLLFTEIERGLDWTDDPKHYKDDEGAIR